VQAAAPAYRRAKPETLLNHHTSLKTDHWDAQVPRFGEMDLVLHSCNSLAGDFCYPLNLTNTHLGGPGPSRSWARASRPWARLWRRSVRPPFSLRGKSCFQLADIIEPKSTYYFFHR
jgi:hypothetical protein